MSRPIVLLTNDDGYGVPGIEALAEVLGVWARVVIVAPQSEQSACSHKFSLHEPVRLRGVGRDRWVLDGTPADCVYVGIHRGTPVLDRPPDLVVSGVNAGVNLGLDVYYSGTVAAAREAAIRGVPGLAVSMDTRQEPSVAARYADWVARVMLRTEGWHISEVGLPWVLNLNVPAGARGSVVPTRLGRRFYDGSVEVRVDPRGREYMWIGGTSIRNDERPGTDTAVFVGGGIGLSRVPLLPEECAQEEALRRLVDEVNEMMSSSGQQEEDR